MAVLPGAPLFKSDVAVARHPVRTHTVDIETIGAGGGSIAAVQLGGVLKVGPQSAGADPGPACYGRGGSAPTLTDALVVARSSRPDGAARRRDVDRRSARRVRRGQHARGRAARDVGDRGGLGILRVLATNVMAAMRTITVERGYDPREFTLVPFGGIGPRSPAWSRPSSASPASSFRATRHLQRLRDAGDRRAAGPQPHAHHVARRDDPAELDLVFAEMEEAASRT